MSQGTIYLYDTHSRNYKEVLRVTNQDVDIGSPALSHDNRTLFYTHVTSDADIWVMDSG